jgi:hypothetical protein
VFLGVFGAVFAFKSWAADHNGSGVLSIAFMVLSAIFILPAFLMLAARLANPRILELAEDAVALPNGFALRRIRHIRYADINRMWEHSFRGEPVLHIVTAEGWGELWASRLPDIASYHAIKGFIYSRASILRSQYDQHEPPVKMTWEKYPKLILRWREPGDYPRYRTHLVASRPLLPRVARTLAWFGIWTLPGFLLLSLLHRPVGFYLGIAIPAALWLTWVYWMYTHYPARCREISFHDDDIVVKSGLQTGNSKYQDISGWAMIERQYEDHIISFLLLKYPRGVASYALPDAETRDRLAQLLQEKQVPESPDLRPRWE